MTLGLYAVVSKAPTSACDGKNRLGRARCPTSPRFKCKTRFVTPKRTIPQAAPAVFFHTFYLSDYFFGNCWDIAPLD
jgi:hypothetical protein